MIEKLQPRLSRRLSIITDMAENGNIIADIGTDHGYVPIKLIRENAYHLAIAADVNQNALEIARRNIKENGMQDKISCILSDGLEQINETPDCIVISGMGGELISKILNNGIEKAKKADKLIIQAQSKWEALRKSLLLMKLYPVDEKIIYEDGHFYMINKLSKDSDIFYSCINRYGMEAFFLYGLLPLLHLKDKTFQNYVSTKVLEYNKILNSINKPEQEAKRIETLKLRLELSKNLII